jgi:hypothetical protein
MGRNCKKFGGKAFGEIEAELAFWMNLKLILSAFIL